MGRPRLSVPSIVDRAVSFVDREGFDALTLSAVAGELGVGPSALYTHVDGLDGLQYLVAARSTGNLGSVVRDAAIGTAGPDALTAMGEAYRTFALEHPGQFASTLLPPRSDDDELAREDRRLLDVFVAVFAAMGLPRDESYLAARSTRSAIHGFLALEHNSGSTAAHAAEYEHMLGALQRGLLGSVGPGPRPAGGRRRSR
jgi:AcrR family transcriptional regulator